MEIAKNWTNYEILDMANGEKLERWNNVILIRPDPQIIWKEKTFRDKKEYQNNLIEYDNKIKKLEEDINLYTTSYQETIKRIRKDEYWISHYKRNRKIKKITREILKELIQNIYVNEDGSIKIVFKYEDEYKELLNYLQQEGSVSKCLNGKLASI